jgi:class 3 adenylate cyclase
MRMPLLRFGEELYLYNSQIAFFFVMIIFMTSSTVSMGILSALIIIIFMLLQTILLVGQGHKPLLRFLFSLLTPAGYSLLKAITSTLEFSDSVNILLWCAAAFIGLFQAISLATRSGFLKRAAEFALSIGSAIIFISFYAYLDIRINLGKSLAAGQIDQATYQASLQFAAFPQAFQQFAVSPQHLFALLGVLSYDSMLLIARIRTLTLRNRIGKLLDDTGRGGVVSVPPQPSDSSEKPVKLVVSVISSDIIGFTDFADRLGSAKSAALLNRYYSLWSHVSAQRGGRIVSITGDTVMVLFGLVDEYDNAERALASAYSFMDELAGFRDDISSQSFPADIKVSIGVHSGIVVSANLGPPDEKKRTVFGDTMAVAARLDSLCRELHQELLVSHSTFRRLSLESQATLDRIGEVLLRKSTRPVPVYTRK